MISSSIVRQDPPALMILARAASEKRRAATSSFGISKILMSSVTVPTTTTVLDVLLPRCLIILLRETGGLMVLDATSLLRMVLQKLESVRLERNLKSCAKQMQRNILESCRAHKLKCLKFAKYLPSREDVDKDSCFSCPSSPFSIFCLFYTSRCPIHKRKQPQSAS